MRIVRLVGHTFLSSLIVVDICKVIKLQEDPANVRHIYRRHGIQGTSLSVWFPGQVTTANKSNTGTFPKWSRERYSVHEILHLWRMKYVEITRLDLR